MAQKTGRLTVAGKIEPEVNRYYAKIAGRYTAAGIAALVIFLLYVGSVIVFASDSITTENLSYLVRDFGTAADDSGRDFGRIVYNGSSSTAFSWFRGGLAVCSPDSYRYFDKNGLSVVADPLNYADPVAVPGEKYMLVYDMGGTGWTVYNQLTRIVSRQAEDRIIAADIASDGSVVMVTRSRDTRYVVSLYNAAFNRTMLSYKDGYVLAAAISGDGEQFLVASASPSTTDFDCEIELIRRGEDTPLAKDVLSHTMPLMAKASEKGFVILCDSAVLYYDEYGVRQKTVSLTGMTLKYADISSGRAALAGQVNALGSEHRILVLDADGSVLCDRLLRQRVSGIGMSRNISDALCYVRGADTVLRIGPGGEEETYAPENGEIIGLVPLNAGALVCQKSAAWQIFTESSDS